MGIRAPVFISSSDSVLPPPHSRRFGRLTHFLLSPVTPSNRVLDKLEDLRAFRNLAFLVPRARQIRGLRTVPGVVADL